VLLPLTSEQGRVLYRSATVEGRRHGEALADEAELGFGPGQRLLLDLGFQGYSADGAQPCLPVEKPPKGQLSELDQSYNRLLASLRVTVEHVIACGLHNLRIDHRKLS
jgi:hypothetical protein